MPITKRFNVLMPLRSQAKNKSDLYGFDVETLHKQENGYITQKFLLGSVYGKNVSRVFNDREEMQAFLLSRKFRNKKIYATNLDFDFHILFDNSDYWKNMFVIERHGLIFAKYMIKHENDLNQRRTIKFYDTWNYTGKTSVDAMGKLLNIPKINKPSFLGQMPDGYDQLKELSDYCLRDSEITYNFAEFMQDFCNTHNAKYKITLASIGMDFWRRNFQEIPLWQEKRFILERHYKAFHGGRVEMFKRGYINDPVYFYDFNSHYPACCFNGVDNKGSYPDPNSSHFLNKGDLCYIEQYEGISYIEMKMPYAYIMPVGMLSDDNKFVFPYGVIKGFFTHIEIRECLKYGAEIINIGECIYYSENFIPFRECIDYLYKKRFEYKDQGNELMSQMVKTIMNGGIFGKFAQKLDDKDKIIFDQNVFCNEIGELFYTEDGRTIKLKKFVQRGHLFYEKVKTDHVPNFIQPILSTYTTALARIRLFKEMNQYKDDVIYCDTDSIMSLKPHFEDSKDLGELKLEKVSKEALFILPKLYYYIDENDNFRLKSKGLPKTINEKAIFEQCLDQGFVENDHWLRFKEAGVRKMEFASIIKQNKKISSDDTKRAWNKAFNKREMQDSMPLLYTQ